MVATKQYFKCNIFSQSLLELVIIIVHHCNFRSTRHRHNTLSHNTQYLLLLRNAVNNIEEVGLERSSADKSTIDVGLGKQILGVGTLHTTTVLDADSLGNGLADILAHPLTDEGMRLLSHLGGGSETSADGPDGLVGNGDVLPILLLEKLSGRGELRSTDIVGGAILTLLLLLSNSEHYLETSIEGDLDLLGNQVTVLSGHAETLPALGVADADPDATDVLQLGGADLAGVGTLLVVDAAILCSDGNVIPELGKAEGDVDEGGADGNLNVSGDGPGLVEGVDELGEGGNGAVALPVAADEVLALAFLGRAALGRTGGTAKVKSTLHLLGNSLNLCFDALHFVVVISLLVKVRPGEGTNSSRSRSSNDSRYRGRRGGRIGWFGPFG